MSRKKRADPLFDLWDNSRMPDDRTAARSAFSNVDASASGARLIGYLDAARKAPGIVAAKGWSVEQLALRPGMSVLDVGCGTGEDVVAMAGLVLPGGRATGIDGSAFMVHEARTRHGGQSDVDFVRADARHLPFDAAAFDACRCERTLQHVEDPAQAVAEMARVLRQGGRITLLEPDWGTLIVGGLEPGAANRIIATHVQRHPQPFIGRNLRGLLSSHGFTEVELNGSPLIYTDLASANRAFGMWRAADVAVSAGVVSQSEGVRWSEGLQEADANGSFFASVTGFRASARSGTAAAE